MDAIAIIGVPKELLATPTTFTLIRYALSDWSIIAAIWLLAPHTPGAFYPLWVVLLAGRIHALGVVLHDAIHIPRGPKTPALRVCEILAGYPIGSTINAMRYHHLRHHARTACGRIRTSSRGSARVACAFG